ncbi:MAG: NAD(P)-dependent oxidoreductase [Armatimonadetes bacterium]|nr:NAD(P)-dependent oxidoreductase [Armatimonadota bacterium]
MIPIGFIGLGIMGRPMAGHLVKAGFPVRVFNRSIGPVERLVSQGAMAADSVEDCARQAEILFTCLPEDETVLAVWRTALPHLSLESIGIDCSTVSPDTARAIATEAGKIAFLDAPITGGQWGAEAGTLTFMVGGDRLAFERARPAFEAMGRKIIHTGESGSGQMTKLTNQIAVATGILAVCEALTFASAAGLDLDTTIEALSSGAAGSWAMENLGTRIAKRDFNPGFMVKLLQKDLRLVMRQADRLGVALPGVAGVRELFKMLETEEGERLGIQALALVIEKLSRQR